MKYHILIVDDEAPAREKIAQFLGQLEWSFDFAFAKNAKEAIEQLDQCSFDLMFLDIQMPQMDAFEMLRSIGLEHCPPIIFSTAYNQYALKAFEVHAIDYLLKPYDFDRFQASVYRVLQLITQQAYSNQTMMQMLKDWKPTPQKMEILWVNQGTKLLPIEVKTIEYLESDGNYVLIHSAGHKYMLRQSLVDLKEKLNAQQFIRVHRSFVVNQMSISELHPKSHGDLFAVLKSGAKIPVSRRYRDQLIK